MSRDRMHLYLSGFNDRKIARLEGVSHTSIRGWRASRNLPANARPGSDMSPEREEARLALYQAGLSDNAIGEREGKHAASIGKWRSKRGLALNPSKHILPPNRHDERLRLWNGGLTDREIGAAINVEKDTIHAWRVSHGLSSHAPSVNHTPEQRAARIFLYGLGYSDARIAREQRVRVGSVFAWRKRLGLPPVKRAQRVNGRIDRAGDVLTRIRRAVGRGLPGDIADDAVADLYLAIVSGALSIDRIEAEAKKFGNRVLGQFASKFGPRSLDEEMGDEDGFKMLDLIRDERSSDWLEEMGATVW